MVFYVKCILNYTLFINNHVQKNEGPAEKMGDDTDEDDRNGKQTFGYVILIYRGEQKCM